MVQPSCPILVILDDDPFRKVELLRTRAGSFKVILLGIDLEKQKGMSTGEFLREHRDGSCGVIIIGEPTPELRTFAPWADETLMKPVDADYVANRAWTYCDC